MAYIPVEDLFPHDIYELYNERLVADQYYIDTIIASIKFQMWYHIQEGLEYKFNYDAEEWLENVDRLTQMRVIDQVIKFFRSRGIRIYINNLYKFNLDPTQIQIPGAGYNYGTSFSMVLYIEWFVRQGQEYMKAYL